MLPTTLFVSILNIPVISLIGATDGGYQPAILCICTKWVPTLVSLFCRLCTLSFPFGLVPSGIAVSLCLYQMLFASLTHFWYMLTSSYLVLQMFFLLSLYCHTLTFVHHLFHRDRIVFLPQQWCLFVPTVPYCHSMETWKSLHLYMYLFIFLKVHIY